MTDIAFKAVFRLKDGTKRTCYVEQIIDPVQAHAILMAEAPHISVGLILIETKINSESPAIAA